VKAFRESTFLRVDDKSSAKGPWNRLLNSLDSMNFFLSLISKFLLMPFWLILRFQVPTIYLKGVSKDISKLTRWPNANPFCLRIRYRYFGYSLSRVIILNEFRVEKKGRVYSAIRNELNSLAKRGFKSKALQNDDAAGSLDAFFALSGKRNWRNITQVPSTYEDIQLLATIVENKAGEPIAASAAFVSGCLVNNFYYFGLIPNSVRWLATEKLVEEAYAAGVKYFRTDNLLDVSHGSYEFQKKMGYVTCNLKWA
jgi:hypothetical protein